MEKKNELILCKMLEGFLVGWEYECIEISSTEEARKNVLEDEDCIAYAIYEEMDPDALPKLLERCFLGKIYTAEDLEVLKIQCDDHDYDLLIKETKSKTSEEVLFRARPDVWIWIKADEKVIDPLNPVWVTTTKKSSAKMVL